MMKGMIGMTCMIDDAGGKKEGRAPDYVQYKSARATPVGASATT